MKSTYRELAGGAVILVAGMVLLAAVWWHWNREDAKQTADTEITRRTNTFIIYEHFTDPRDGQVYRTVTIGGQTWMAQNLNFKTDNSRCYEDKEHNCREYGRLYDWHTAKTVCPSEWHLPGEEEWETLVKYAGPQAFGDNDGNAGTKLKAAGGWAACSECKKPLMPGTDDYGFSALPGGFGNPDGSFSNANHYGYWWSAAKSTASHARYRSMYYGLEYVYGGNYNKAYLFSVRCVRDR